MAANNYATIAANPVSPKAVRAAVNLKFGPQTHALQNRQKAIPAWYAHYLQTVQQNRDATRQAYAGANQAVANQTTAGAADAAAASQRDLGAAQNDAAARGGTVDPGAALRATQAAGVEKSYADSYGGMLALQGANNQSRFDQLASAGAGDQLVQQNRVRDALSQLRGQRGDYAVQYLQQAAAAQEKAALDAATQAALQSYQQGNLANTAASINERGQAAAGSTGARNYATDQSNATRIKVAKIKGQQQQQKYLQGARSKSADVNTALENTIDLAKNLRVRYDRKNTFKGDKAALRDAIKQSLESGTYQTDPATGAYTGKRVDGYLTDAALDALFNGGIISHTNIRRLHNKGARGLGRYEIPSQSQRYQTSPT